MNDRLNKCLFLVICLVFEPVNILAIAQSFLQVILTQRLNCFFEFRDRGKDDLRSRRHILQDILGKPPFDKTEYPRRAIGPIGDLIERLYKMHQVFPVRRQQKALRELLDHLRAQYVCLMFTFPDAGDCFIFSF